MPGLTGLQLAQEITDVEIVFVTAYDHYAVAAFERAAVDDLLKPVSDKRLAATVERIKARLGQHRKRAASGPAPEIIEALTLLHEYLPQVAPDTGAQHTPLAWIRAAVG